MKYRFLPNAGLQVSEIGLGCNNFGGPIDLEGTRKVVHKALDLGITLFDNADVYPMTDAGRSEECLGQIMGDRRKDIVLATKFGMPMDKAQTMKGASRRYIMTAVEASLQRLKTDWIDLLQVHRPDPNTPIEETLRALDDLVQQGKVRYIGCSNYAAWEMVEALWASKSLGLNSFVTSQNEYSLLARDIDQELLPAMQKYDVALLPFFPLASGLLTGKYKVDADIPADSRFAKMPMMTGRFMTERNWHIVGELQKFCDTRGHSLLELAFSWLLARPNVVSVIAGATRPEQLEQNATAGDWTLSSADLAEIDSLTS